MKKYIISKLKERGLNETGEANINDLFRISFFLIKLVLIPVFSIGLILLLEAFYTILKII